MNNQVVIKVENVSKIYKLFHNRSHRLIDALKLSKKELYKEFYALKDVSFEILKGSTVGILGQNGSGKSTLLQIITSILKPTFGKVQVEGRIAALLELGAGFNPELTGRENVLMNGIIMGLSKSEIMSRMETIKEFSDIGEFFDQPMKIYSSGMFMRVAFSAAIHVDPDILIIDEALAVGDAKFQEKCFRKFRQFQNDGKTIFLVTHDRSAVPRLCNVGLLLHHGKLIGLGEPKEIVNLYSNILTTGNIIEYKDEQKVLKQNTHIGKKTKKIVKNINMSLIEKTLKNFIMSNSIEDKCSKNNSYNKNEYRYGNRKALIIDYLIYSEDDYNITTIECGKSINIILKIYFEETIQQPIIGLSVRNTQGLLISGLNSNWLQSPVKKAEAGTVGHYTFTVCMNLKPGSWFIELAVASSMLDICDIRNNIIQIDVFGNSKAFDGLVFLNSDLKEVV